jgi:hypothetical protein
VVATLVCHQHFAHEAAVQRAPGIPHALCFLHDSGALRGEIANVYLELERRHCEERRDEAIHTFFAVLWIASLGSQ